LAQARSELATGEALESMPATLEATLTGELSLAQATEIARAEFKAPGSEPGMLEVARHSGLAALRHEARKVALGSVSPEELYAIQQKARSFFHWIDDVGMVRGNFALPPSVGVPLLSRIETEAGRLRRAATGSTRERFDAYAADALVGLLQGKGKGSTTRTDVVYVIDLEAARRGHAHPGEVCHLVGAGPVPVNHVAEVAEDAFVKAVTFKGERVETIAHFGRHIPAELRTALELGEPPGFEGAVCAEPNCGRRYGLEWDHVDPLAHRGPTSYDNLVARCKPHHWQKTERDRQAGLLTPEPP